MHGGMTLLSLVWLQLREGDALRTLKKLKDGMPLVKHTVGSNLGFTKVSVTGLVFRLEACGLCI